ncbi:MAG: hypothetical protein WBC51_13465 [Vicinamibacterales bacterium]
MRKAVSITLEADNLLWLRAQAAATSRGSLSAVLDRIVEEARLGGRTEPTAIRSVAGTIDLPEDDPDLAKADAYVRSVFTASARQPILVRERSGAIRTQRKRRG